MNGAPTIRRQSTERPIFPDVPTEFITDADRQLDGDDRLRMQTVEPGDYLGAYSDRQLKAGFIAGEKAARRLGLTAVSRVDAVVCRTWQAQQRIDGVAVRTPIVDINPLINDPRIDVGLKNEGVQPMGSYKIRGAYGMIVEALETEDFDHVVSQSAGNAGANTAYAAFLLNLKASIIMPVTAPYVKQQLCLDNNAEVILSGNNYSQSSAATHTFMSEHAGAKLVPAYDHPSVITHQGTMGAEILQDEPVPPDYVFIPVGGGGAAAGIASYIKSVSPKTVIVGVQPEDSCAMQRSRRLGRIIRHKNVGTFADGVAVEIVSDLTFDMVQAFVDHIITVSPREIGCAVAELHAFGLPAEGAGALAQAGIKKYAKHTREMRGRVVGILSGRQLDDERLRYAQRLAA